ncbi:hypothetical protein M0R45_022220 [Rubus argutus]|uniref:Uncharacterized protein n=1 Tax=Rubus argutus TaxID=59490 RepID=A0AAW1XFU1_RUBAR
MKSGFASSSNSFMENVDQPHVLAVDDSGLDLKLSKSCSRISLAKLVFSYEKLLYTLDDLFWIPVNDSEQICDLLKGISDYGRKWAKGVVGVFGIGRSSKP